MELLENIPIDIDLTKVRQQLHIDRNGDWSKAQELVVREYMAQGEAVAADLKSKDVEIAPDSEMAAMIAYLQHMGSTIPAVR